MWKFKAPLFVAAIALALFGLSTRVDAKTIVLLCKGTEYCDTCAPDQKKVEFEWSYAVDLSTKTVDGHRAIISDERITWQFDAHGVLDQREINRFTKKYHFYGQTVDDGRTFYYGDGVCETQEKQAF